MRSILLALAGVAAAIPSDCPGYTQYAETRHPPYSAGKRNFPFQRPEERCRTHPIPEVERIINDDMKSAIKDPDLHRLFENTWPNTLDTTVLWKGVSAENANEELSFIITGDINAMWLRDSANQLQSYKSIIHGPSDDGTGNDMASLFRGAINLQGRYIRQFPHCNAFQPPPESGMGHAKRSIEKRDEVKPPYKSSVVFECKYELDSLAAFLQLSWDYYEASGDRAFFGKFAWADTVRTILKTVKELMIGTYATDGSINESPYTWQRQSTRSTETVANNGHGDPVKGGVGLIRSFFRPSDDACVYQYLIPANMMFSRYLGSCADIMRSIDGDLADEMADIAANIVQGINNHAVVRHPEFGNIYAYESDGYFSRGVMDDANLPSLLSIPHLGYENSSSTVYQNTRKFVLSTANPYYAWGPVLNATGGPHLGPGRGWPMAVIMQIMTSDDDDEIENGIRQLLGSTGSLGLIHETVSSHNEHQWSRPWFAWANGLFGQMILDLKKRKPHLLSRSYQN
ncbi:hypothetical protein B0I35DRAFT_478108 [Stachybotrys elegans]|uniref:Glycoside hydrolase family 125 protein n=1 Tax=Stachybotrys elegans TaxID=80388 RepID=A0A8K0SSG2_9HYPO|nr:hypothetical protein B0I35DRAFT_478108 [Stachybotrys elegans]